jgi:hypothetical protein
VVLPTVPVVAVAVSWNMFTELPASVVLVLLQLTTKLKLAKFPPSVKVVLGTQLLLFCSIR